MLMMSQAGAFSKEVDKQDSVEHIELFSKILHLIEKQYYRPVERAKLMEGAIKGMMQTLDPHTSYLGPELFKQLKEETAGEFGGLGIEVTEKNGMVYIVTPIEDSPAYKAGIERNDQIVEVNGQAVIGLNLEMTMDLLKGKVGDIVQLGIKREGEKKIKRFEIKRQIIQVKPVKSEIIDAQYIYLRLSHFQKRAGEILLEEFQKQKKIMESKKESLKGIILDLRSNPGGLLEEAVNVSSLFLSGGVVVSTRARDENQRDVHYVKKSIEKDTQTPMVVLINGASASAAEIVAGALQDHGRAIIAGTDSFGKGSVQTVVQLDNDKGIKLTIAQYLTPNKRRIQATGIKPDILVYEAEGEWIAKNLHSDQNIRESDLKNHLSAMIETPEEKKERLEKAKLKRKEAQEELERLKKTSIEKNSSHDYQVLQAVQILKASALSHHVRK